MGRLVKICHPVDGCQICLAHCCHSIPAWLQACCSEEDEGWPQVTAQQTVKSHSQGFRSSSKVDMLLLGSLPCLWGSVWTSESKPERRQMGKRAVLPLLVILVGASLAVNPKRRRHLKHCIGIWDWGRHGHSCRPLPEMSLNKSIK